MNEFTQETDKKEPAPKKTKWYRKFVGKKVAGT